LPAVERESEHRLAKAVVHRGGAAGIPRLDARDFTNVPGQDLPAKGWPPGFRASGYQT